MRAPFMSIALSTLFLWTVALPAFSA
ncbi:MAG: hypothetical protein QOJ54_3156, partial [Aliidongia sp.]|nr:hypothetical protein [Aliidongia sp.]